MKFRKLPVVAAKSALAFGCAAGLVSFRVAAQAPYGAPPAPGTAGVGVPQYPIPAPAGVPAPAGAPAAAIAAEPGAAGAAPAQARSWGFVPAIDVSETYTDNANLTATDRLSSFVTSVTPALAIAGNGARVKLNGTVAAQALLYRGERDDSQLYPRANLLGSVEAIEKFFYVEGAVNVYQTYLSAFGAQPAGNIGQTNNRYTSSIYRVSPYFSGTAPGGATYLLRNDNVWTEATNTPAGTAGVAGAYYNQTTGRLEGPVRPVNGAVEFFTNYTKFEAQPSIRTALTRGILNYRPDPQLRLFASGGYEWNDYPLQQSQGTIYGGGAEWRPTDRTQALGQWEHRFFGASYLGTFTHRNPYSAISVSALRNVYTFPQELFSLPAGGNVTSLVDAALTTRIPDPTQRAVAVQDFLRQTGLPATLQSSVTFYTQQVQLITQESATFALIGVRNTLALTAYYRKTEVISGANATPLPPALVGIGTANNTQRGGSVTFSHRLTEITSLGATANHFWTTDLPPLDTRSTTTTIQLGTTTRLGPRTDALAGVGYTKFTSTAAPEYNESHVLVGLAHKF
jgi:uncharacterized protein (PEP-CTERM system associated)